MLMVVSSRWLFPYPDGMRQRRFSEVTRHQSHVRHGRHFTRLIGAASADVKLQSILLSLDIGQRTLLGKACVCFKLNRIDLFKLESMADPVATF